MAKQLLLFFWTIGFLATAASAQPNKTKQPDGKTPFVLGIVDTLYSSALGETRTLNIYLPEGYSPDSSATYPVIYLLDGSANEDFVHTAGAVQFLTMIEAMPKSILVGIANIDRRRDFTFPTTIKQDKKDYPTTGSSERFIAFIETELQPFVQKNYKTDSAKTIIGQSLGGLLATEVLLKKPYLFTNYFIVSPSLWWDNESLLKMAPALLEKGDVKNRHVYISAGSEGPQMERDVKQLVELLKTSGKKNWAIGFVPLPSETHLTILHNSIYKCFGLLYAKKAEQKK